MPNPQAIKDIIKTELKNDKSKSVKEMCQKCGLNKNILSTMAAGSMPKLENISKIADYLGVSVDYLLGRNKKILTVDSEDSELEPIAVKATKSDWKRILSRLSEENLNRLQEYAELLLLKQAQDGQEE